MLTTPQFAELALPTENRIIKQPLPIDLHPHQLTCTFDSLQGGEETYRWIIGADGSSDYLDSAILHIKSIAAHGMLLFFPVVKLPEDYTTKLDGKDKTYKKGDYITIDFSGRLRSTMCMLENGYVFDNGNKIRCCDCTEQVLKGRKKMTDDVIEDLSDVVIALSTGAREWDYVQFILTNAAVVQDRTENRKFTWLKDKIINFCAPQGTKDNNKLTVNHILKMTMGRKPNIREIRSKKLNLDLRIKRYSNLIIKTFSKLRNDMTSQQLPAPFIEKIAEILYKSAKNGCFIGKKYVKDLVTTSPTFGDMIIKNPDKDIDTYFNSKHKLYSDEHYAEFEMILGWWMYWIVNKKPDGGWQNTAGGAGKEIYATVLELRDYFRHEWEGKV